MTELLERAISALSALKTRSATQQNNIANHVLELLEDETRWDQLFEDPRSDKALANLVSEARLEIARGDVHDFDPATKPVK